MPNPARLITIISGLAILFAVPAYAAESPTTPAVPTQPKFVSTANERFAQDTKDWHTHTCQIEGLRAGAYVSHTGYQSNANNTIVTYAAYNIWIDRDPNITPCTVKRIAQRGTGAYVLLIPTGPHH
jgi:hypothetical protein